LKSLRLGGGSSAFAEQMHTTVIYIDQDMRLAEPRNGNQKIDWEAWCPEVKVGEVIDAKLTPVLYPGNASGDRLYPR
jgi:hypothetical protein